MKLSIIIPAHNVEKYINTILQCVFNQTFKDFEVLCILDDCTDGTKQIVEQYPVRIFECNYRQPGLTRNIGLDNALGEWIWCLDSDDWLLTDTAFEQVVEQLDDNINLLTINNYSTHAGLTSRFSKITMWSNVMRRDYLNKYNIRFLGGYYDEDVMFLFGYKRRGRSEFNQKIWENQAPLYFYNVPRTGSVRFNYDFGEKLILAFTGCGKSTYCRENAGWIDLDLGYHEFENSDELLVKLCAHFLKDGWKVLTPVSRSIMELLRQNGMWINVILPSSDMKAEILDRIRKRDGHTAWVTLVEKEYDKIYNEIKDYPYIDNLYIMQPGETMANILTNWKLTKPTLRSADKTNN